MKPRTRQNLLGFAAVAAAALAAAATSPLPRPTCDSNVHRALTAWTVVGGDSHSATGVATTVRGCATMDAWVSRSGREGVGLTLEVRATGGESCDVLLGPVELSTAQQHVRAPLANPSVHVGQEGPVLIYVPLPFDNDRAWADGDNRATVQVATGAERPWSFDLAQVEARTDCSEAQPQRTILRPVP